MNTNFLFRAAEANDSITQRARADENETNGFHHFFRRVAMRRFLHVDHNVGAVKRDDARPRPAQDQRQQDGRRYARNKCGAVARRSDRELSAVVALHRSKFATARSEVA